MLRACITALCNSALAFRGTLPRALLEDLAFSPGHLGCPLWDSSEGLASQPLASCISGAETPLTALGSLQLAVFDGAGCTFTSQVSPLQGAAFPLANPSRQPSALLRFWLPQRRNSGSGPDPLWIFSPGLDSLQRSGASSFGFVVSSVNRFHHLRVGFQRLGLLVTSLRSGSSVAPRLTLGGAWSGALPRAKSTLLEIYDFCGDPDVYGDPTYAQTSRLVRLNSSVGRKPSGIPSSLGKLRLSLALRNSTIRSDLEGRGCRETFQSSYPLRAQSNPSGRVRQ